MKIPEGWTLVPNTPTQSMLDEFSGVYWPEREKWGELYEAKRLLELQAYSAMLLATPTPPTRPDAEIEALQTRYRVLLGAYRRLRKAHSSLLQTHRELKDSLK